MVRAPRFELLFLRGNAWEIISIRLAHLRWLESRKMGITRFSEWLRHKATPVDRVLTRPDILRENNWIHFKLYKIPSTTIHWKTALDWYHEVLITIVKPLVENNDTVRVVLFGIYVSDYGVDQEEYKKQISPPSAHVTYIRLRLSVAPEHQAEVERKLVDSIGVNSNLVWEYEVMRTYHVRNDLGNRFGSNDDAQTLRFVRYWDAACRYIMSILTPQTNWRSDVDVRGILHMVTNSLGSTLRVSSSASCPACRNGVMFLETQILTGQQVTVSLSSLPLFFVRCGTCNHQEILPCNV